MKLSDLAFPLVVKVTAESGDVKTLSIPTPAKARLIFEHNLDMVMDVLCDGPLASKIDWPIVLKTAAGQNFRITDTADLRQKMANFGVPAMRLALGKSDNLKYRAGLVQSWL